MGYGWELGYASLHEIEEVEVRGVSYTKLDKYKIAYLSMQIRTGKTLTALSTADLFLNSERKCYEYFVLFLTKKISN